jgi:hypothetical protein
VARKIGESAIVAVASGDYLEHFAADIRAGTVRRILRNHEPGKIAISDVRPASRRQASKVAVFTDFLAELFAGGDS